MTARRIFPFLLLAGAAFLGLATGFGPKIIKGPLPSVVASPWDGTPQGIPGISHRWVYTNGIILDTSKTPSPGRITNWTALIGVDSSQGQPARFTTNYPTPSTKWPTNVTSKGIYFEGWSEGHALITPEDLEVTNNASMSVAMIIEPVQWSYPSIGLLGNARTVAACGITTRSSDSNIVVDARNTALAQDLCTFGPLTAALTDFVVCFSNSPAGGGVLGYINGAIKTNHPVAALTDLRTKWGLIGLVGTGYYEGWIREILFYTNVMTSESISNFHYYRTNLYGGTP